MRATYTLITTTIASSEAYASFLELEGSLLEVYRLLDKLRPAFRMEFPDADLAVAEVDEVHEPQTHAGQHAGHHTAAGVVPGPNPPNVVRPSRLCAPRPRR